jgi:hypothetical protein
MNDCEAFTVVKVYGESGDGPVEVCGAVAFDWDAPADTAVRDVAVGPSSTAADSYARVAALGSTH